MSAALHPDFLKALREEIRDPDLEAFVSHLDELVHRAVQRQDLWSITPAEIKLLVRHRCWRFDETAGSKTFGDGSYFPFFTGIYVSTMADKQLLLQALEALYELCEGLDDPVSAAAATSSRVIRTWSKLAQRDTPLAPTPATQLMLWRVFESVVKGEIEVVETHWGDRVRHYPRFATAQMLVQRRADPRRAEVLSNLKFTLGCASLRRPPLIKLLERDGELSDEHREVLINAVGSRDPSTAEPISALLRHHIELIALSDYDRLEVFSDLIVDFVTHLRGDVLAVGRAPENAAMIAYLRVLQSSYLPGLFNYARILRKASLGSPFLGDLLHESYLVRTRSFDGDREPSFAQILQDWVAAQRVIQARAGYKSTKGFSFAQAYLEEAAPVAVAPGRAGQTQHGFAVKELGDFETYIELPRQSDRPESDRPESDRPEGAAGDFGDGDVDESAETRPYQRVNSSELRQPAPPSESNGGLPPIGGPPPSGPRVLPVRLGSMDNMYSAPTEILPIFTDDAVELYTAVTEFLPTTPDGTVDLQRVATQLFPTLPGRDPGEDG
jgi:hypothetical protein